MKDYMTTEETLEYFQISSTTLREWRKRGLPVVKIGRARYYSAESLKEFLAYFETREDYAS